MKKLVSLLTAAAMLFSSFAFATDSDKVNARVKTAFLADFSAASAVNWEKISDFYFATFMINKAEVNAAYNEDGELVGTSRPLETAQLPINISLALSKKYDGYTVSPRALELTYDGTTYYYVNISNDRLALKLKCSPNGNIDVERKIKKK
ncbi:MAG: hypothetical protein ABIQ31_26575 [Ferruginibacter sp.]